MKVKKTVCGKESTQIKSFLNKMKHCNMQVLQPFCVKPQGFLVCFVSVAV